MAAASMGGTARGSDDPRSLALRGEAGSMAWGRVSVRDDCGAWYGGGGRFGWPKGGSFGVSSGEWNTGLWLPVGWPLPLPSTASVRRVVASVVSSATCRAVCSLKGTVVR